MGHHSHHARLGPTPLLALYPSLSVPSHDSPYASNYPQVAMTSITIDETTFVSVKRGGLQLGFYGRVDGESSFVLDNVGMHVEIVT